MQKKIHFTLKIDFYRCKNICLYQMRCIRINLSKIFPMETSEFKNSISVESYDEKKKTAENYQNLYDFEKCIVS